MKSPRSIFYVKSIFIIFGNDHNFLLINAFKNNSNTII